MNHRDLAATARLTLRGMALLSSILGGGSLAALGVFLWAGSYQLIDAGFNTAMILVWDGLLSLTFFVQHSGMLRRGFRRRVGSVIPQHLYPAVYSIVSGLVLLAVLVLWQCSSTEIWSVDAPWRWLFRAVFVFAIAGFVAGIKALRGFDGFGQRPIQDLLRGRTHSPSPLAVRGLYRWVRHPLYTCVLLMIWFCPVVTADRLLFNLLWTLWIVVGTVMEERDLVDEFGEEYSRYQGTVPMLIPWSLRPRWPGEPGVGVANRG